MRHIKLLSIFVTLVFSGFTNLSLAQNIGVHPTTLEFALTSNQSETQVINLSNGSAKKVQFKLYLNDWIRDSAGGHVYYDANTQPRSCAKWITLSKDFVELEPGQSTTVNIKMQVPDNPDAIKEMKWSMLFVETVEEQNAQASKGAQATVNNLLRVGVHIYQTPPSLTKKQMKVYSLTPVPNANNTYQIYCQNIGDIMLDCKAYIELSSMADGKKIKLDAVEFPVFPDQKRYIIFQLPANLPKGKYSALAVVDAGEDLSLEAVETNIEVK
jgi:hypothetical protein